MLFLDKKSQRSKDENGFLIIKNNPIAKAGVFEYLHSELFADGEDVIVKVYRDFEDLKKVKDTFANKPIVHNHKWVGEETDQVDGSIGSEIFIDEDNKSLNANLIIYNPKLIEAIENGLDVELSPAYTGDVEERSGMFESQSYAYVQSLDYANHLAVVQNGRAGKDLKIQDSKPHQTGENMKEKNTLKKIMDSLRKILDEGAKVEDTEEKTEDEATTVKSILESEMSDSEKLEAIRALEEAKTSDEDAGTEEAKTSDEDAGTEEEKTEDEDAGTEEEKTEDEDVGDETAEVLSEMIEKAVEAKMEKFADAQAKQSRRIADTYTKVSDALGTSFNYNGMSPDDIFRFGYESITGQTLDKTMNPETAFLVATSSNRKQSFHDNATAGVESNISKLLNRF